MRWEITRVSWNIHNKNGGLAMWVQVNKCKETKRTNTSISDSSYLCQMYSQRSAKLLLKLPRKEFKFINMKSNYFIFLSKLVLFAWYISSHKLFHSLKLPVFQKESTPGGNTQAHYTHLTVPNRGMSIMQSEKYPYGKWNEPLFRVLSPIRMDNVWSQYSPNIASFD